RFASRGGIRTGRFVMRRLNVDQYKTVLVFTAHPDDLEGFAGGVVYLLSNVHSIIYSGGDRGVWNRQYKRLSKWAFEKLRIQESDEAEKVLHIKSVVDLKYEDRKIPVDDESVGRALDQMRNYRPDAIFSFEYKNWLTYDPHPDHLAVAKIVREAVLCYEDRDQLDYFLFATLAPTHFVNISKVRPIKLRALACHRSQRSLNRIIFPFLEHVPSLVWGVLNGTLYAEGYRRIDIDKIQRDRI